MRLSEDTGFPVLPPGSPTRDLLLAQALDACITAERRLSGSSQEIIARQPAWARAELQRLIGLAGSLDAAASNAIMSSEFRVAARARLMHRIGGDASAPLSVARLSAVPSNNLDHRVSRKRKTVWARSATAGLLAAVLAAAATLTASASALPGDPLYSLKQAQEELGVRLAPDDQERSLALLRQADARLDETARLLRLGRTVDAAETTQRYDQVLERAMSSYVVTIDDTPQASPATAHMDARLSQEQDQLQAMLQAAPAQSRADLREAIVATERGRALVADPRPVERALGRSDRSAPAVAAAVPTMAVEDSPTVVPTVRAEDPTAVPPRRPLLVLPTPTPPVVVADAQNEDAGAANPEVAQVAGVDGQPRQQNTTLIAGNRGSRNSPPQPARPTNTDGQGQGQGSNNQQADSEAAPVAPSVLAHDDHAQAVDHTDLAAQINGRAVPEQTGSQADNRGRSEDSPQPIVARQSGEAATGGATTDAHGSVGSTGARSTGADGGAAAARTVPAQVASQPERASANNANNDHPARDNGGDARVSPTPQVAATKPQATPSPSHRSGDGDSSKPDSPQKPSTSPAPPPAPHGGDAHPGTETHPSSDDASGH